VFADTSVFARTFDQDEWAHAFGLQLTPARVPENKNEAYRLNQWYYGTPPPAENAFAVLLANVQILFSGLQTAGPHLTPDNFRAGMYGITPKADPSDTINTITSYGDHQFWPSPPDPAGLDNIGLLWWNPKAKGEDETGAVGDGMYELVNGGKRYVHGQWPTEPLPLFDTKGAVTIYDNPPAALTPKQYPSPAGSPAAAKG
jgi:hypothetical protein